MQCYNPLATISTSTVPPINASQDEDRFHASLNSTKSTLYPSTSIFTTTFPTSNFTKAISSTEKPLLEQFYLSYKGVHIPLSLTVCSGGVLLNICYIYVLTRPSMSSVVNKLLTAMAVCDSCVMTLYLVYMIRYRLATHHCLAYFYSEGWSTFTLVQANANVSLRALSMWLGVVVGLLRYLILLQRLTFRSKVHENWVALGSIAGMALVVALFNVPMYMSLGVYKVDIGSRAKPDCPSSIYRIFHTIHQVQTDCFGHRAAFWINGIFNKIVPIVLVSLFISFLLHFFNGHEKRRGRLFNNSNSGTGGSRGGQSNYPPTTALAGILITLLITESPNAIMSLLSALSPRLSNTIYLNLGDLFDLFGLINCVLTFILYCSMSRAFRRILLETFSFKKVGLYPPIVSMFEFTRTAKHKHPISPQLQLMDSAKPITPHPSDPGANPLSNIHDESNGRLLTDTVSMSVFSSLDKSDSLANQVSSKIDYSTTDDRTVDISSSLKRRNYTVRTSKSLDLASQNTGSGCNTVSSECANDCLLQNNVHNRNRLLSKKYSFDNTALLREDLNVDDDTQEDNRKYIDLEFCKISYTCEPVDI